MYRPVKKGDSYILTLQYSDRKNRFRDRPTFFYSNAFSMSRARTKKSLLLSSMALINLRHVALSLTESNHHSNILLHLSSTPRESLLIMRMRSIPIDSAIATHSHSEAIDSMILICLSLCWRLCSS